MRPGLTLKETVTRSSSWQNASSRLGYSRLRQPAPQLRQICFHRGHEPRPCFGISFGPFVLGVHGDRRGVTEFLEPRKPASPDAKIDTPRDDRLGISGAGHRKRSGVRCMRMNDLDALPRDELTKPQNCDGIKLGNRRTWEDAKSRLGCTDCQGPVWTCRDDAFVAGPNQRFGQPQNLALTAAPTALGIDVLALRFKVVRDKFDDVIVRTDVGNVDVAWSMREDNDDDLKRLIALCVAFFVYRSALISDNGTVHVCSRRFVLGGIGSGLTPTDEISGVEKPP